MSSDIETPEEDTWDVDALKAVRVFFDEHSKKPVLKYLTSWVGFNDYWDEWKVKEDFGDQEQVINLHKIMPTTFDRTKVGMVWHAPADWIEQEKKAYYEDNAQVLEKANGGKFQAIKERLEKNERLSASLERRKPFTPPIHEVQVEENNAKYRKYLRKQQAQQKKAAKLPPGQSRTSKAKASTRVSIEPTSPEPNVWVKPKTEGGVTVGLRYRKTALSDPLGSYPNDAFGGSRARFATNTGVSTFKTYSVSSQRPRSKIQQAGTARTSVSRGTSMQASSPRSVDSLFDAMSDSESDSSDSIPLARHAASHKSHSVAQGARKVIASESSDSDPPLSKLVIAGRKPKAQGITSATLSPGHTQTSGSMRPLPQSGTKTTSLTPKVSNSNAQKDVRRPAPSEGGHTVALERSEESSKPSAALSLLENETPLRSGSSILNNPQSHPPPSPLFYPDIDGGAGPPMDIDMTDEIPDSINFMEGIINEIPPPSMPDPKIKWSPVELILQSVNAEAELCKVTLQKVTPQPIQPSLKWIHRDGFKIRSFRSQAQISILTLAYEPWQHAQLAAYGLENVKLVDAFTSFLHENSMFALADTSFDGAKLCFYPSHSTALMDYMRIPANSELRVGPLHLLVTVIKPASRLESSGVAPLTQVRNDKRIAHPSLSHRHAIERGIRSLRFPPEIRTALQQRCSEASKRATYVLATVESFAFRHPPTVGIEEKASDDHAKHGVIHQEETQALIHIMNDMGYISRKATDSADIVFIHNAAWSTLKHLLGLFDRLSHHRVWFFAYGPFHALDPQLWGVREVFKRGGILTFTAESILENALQLPKILQSIEESATWMAFVSPLVLGWLQDSLLSNPTHQSAMTGLLNLLEGVKKGQISITTAPPHPWKVIDWAEWLEAGSDFCMPGNFIRSPEGTQDAILDAAEKALHDFGHRNSTLQERKKLIDQRVFDDLRQMMFISVLHTEYRRFIVLHAMSDQELKDWKKDSIEHVTLKRLVDSDTAAFALFRSSTAKSGHPPTPSTAASMRGHFVSPTVG